MAPRRHFTIRCTTDKLCTYLDLAEAQGLSVVAVQFVGWRHDFPHDRDWVIVTHGAPIDGPASRGAFSSIQE